MLLEPSGDGYSLLCSKKQPPLHSYHVIIWDEMLSSEAPYDKVVIIWS
jgi:hypothetical protein